MRALLILFVGFSAALPSLAGPPDLGPARPIKVPAGFEVIKIAGPSLVDRPVVACFDNKGRMFVADSSGSNERPNIQLEKKPHRIVMLEDTDGDGIFDKSTVFADQMSFLQGVMWKDGSLYVGAPPYILKLTDTSGNGKADKREIWFDGKTLTGCANDLHGPYEGPDGYIYWTKGAFANQEYTLPDGKKFSSHCATILRAKPDGSGIEPVMTGGMDNPVDVVFLPNGERIFDTTFLQNPGNGKRDGLIHAVYGAVYGKDHSPVYELPWTSPNLMSPMTHMGPAAPAGLHRYASDQLGKEFTGNLFCAQFNLRTVSRHILKPSGSTYVTEDSPFATSEDVDFHPTDVIEDADGSLIVVDTGGWYKLCCPSSQLVKTDVLGGIYRIRKIGSHKTKVKPHAEPLPPLYWTSLNRDPKGFDLAITGLTDSSLHTRRLAAEALGRIGDKRAVPHLMKALEDKSNDEVLSHSLTYALMQIGDVAGMRSGLQSKNEAVQKQTLIALQNLPNGLTVSDLEPLIKFESKNEALSEVAWWIVSKHPEYGTDMVPFVKMQLSRLDNRHIYPPKNLIGNTVDAEKMRIKQEKISLLLKRIATLTKNSSIQELVASTLESSRSKTDLYGNTFEVMLNSEVNPIPENWYRAIVNVLKNKNNEKCDGAYNIYRLADQFRSRSKSMPGFYTEFLKMLAQDSSYPYAIRAKQALPSGMYQIPEVVFAKVLDPYPIDKKPDPDAFFSDYYITQIENREKIFLLGHYKLTDEQWIKTFSLFPSIRTTELIPFLSNYERSRTEPVGLALVKALNTPEMRARIRVDTVKPIFDKFPEAVKKEAGKLYAELEKSRAGEIAKFETLIKELPVGDIRRGQIVFHSSKANCKACHTIGYVGGKIGPDLTRVGGIRSERDLLESIVFPSASFVRSYEPFRIETKDGRTFNGNIKSESSDEVVLTVAADQEVRIDRKNIDSMVQGKVSVMPSGLDQQMTKQELADLVAFLKANK